MDKVEKLVFEISKGRKEWKRTTLKM